MSSAEQIFNMSNDDAIKGLQQLETSILMNHKDELSILKSWQLKQIVNTFANHRL